MEARTEIDTGIGIFTSFHL